MRILDVIGKESISTTLEVDSKEELLDKMLELAVKSGKILDHEEAKRVILKREKIMSTGIGKGIALPHAKTNTVIDSVGSLAILKKECDFESIDGNPVNIVFLLLDKEINVGNHLRLLSKISRYLNDDEFRTNLLNSKTPDDVVGLFNTVESEE